MSLNQKEIARYLGYGRAELPSEVASYAESCERELKKAVVPRTLTRRLSVKLLTGESKDLSHHLRHCDEGFLYGVTLGAEADLLLRRWSVQDMVKAAVGQAVCAAWLDLLCADLCEELCSQLKEGEYLTPAFSPGYGDWSLSAQRWVLDLLNAPKRIGLTLTNAGMMVPEKSITAVVGISDREEESCGQKCMRCSKTDCPFRAG